VSPASQEIPHTLQKSNFHYSICNSQPPVPILSQINLAHAPPQFSKIYFNITLTPMPESAKLSPSLTFPHQNPAGNFSLPHTCYISCPSQSLYLITQIISGKKYKASGSWLCSFIYLRTGKFVGPCENGRDICVAKIREFYRLDK
jgi:hypothetical protein